MKFHNHHIIGIYFTLAFACYNDNAIKSFLELKNIIYKETECKRLSILPPLVVDLMVLLCFKIRYMIYEHKNALLMWMIKIHLARTTLVFQPIEEEINFFVVRNLKQFSFFLPIICKRYLFCGGVNNCREVWQQEQMLFDYWVDYIV